VNEKKNQIGKRGTWKFNRGLSNESYTTSLTGMKLSDRSKGQREKNDMDEEGGLVRGLSMGRNLEHREEDEHP